MVDGGKMDIDAEHIWMLLCDIIQHFERFLHRQGQRDACLSLLAE